MQYKKEYSIEDELENAIMNSNLKKSAKEEFVDSFNKDKYLADTKELAEAMTDLVSGYSIAQALTALEAAVFFVANIGGDKDIAYGRITQMFKHLNEVYLKNSGKRHVD